MTRARVLILGAVAACVAIVAVVLSSGDDEGPRAFMASDDTSALLVEWTRVGDDLSGSLTQARLVDPAPLLLGDTTLLREKPRELQQGSSAFTGTISDDSVRLRLAGNAQVPELNGRLDGDALTLIFTQENGPETINFNPSSRKEFSAAIARLRAAEARRSRNARTTREHADAKAKAAITRVAIAYEKALAPSSPDDPCRYLSAAAKGDVVDDPSPEAPTGGSCTAIVHFYKRQPGNAPPNRLGAAEIELRTLVRVPGGSGGNLADGAELRFAAMPNDPIGLVHEDGQWRIAEYR
jgi:hypothetical protein